MAKLKAIFIYVIVGLAILSIGYGVYLYIQKPIVLPPQATQEADVPAAVKNVPKIKKSLNVKVYDKEKLDKKYSINIKPTEDVSAIGVISTETGKTYITSVIDTASGDSKILTTNVKDKFKIVLQPSLYAEVKAIGSTDSDLARLGIKADIVRINGNIDIYVKGEGTIRENKSGYGVYGGISWSPFK